MEINEYINFMIKVVRLKDLIKYFVLIVLIIVILMLIINIFKNKNKNINGKRIIEDEIAIIDDKNKKDAKKIEIAVVQKELPISKNDMMLDIKNNELDNNTKENNNEEDNKAGVEQKNEEIVHPKDGVKIEVVKNAVNPKTTNEYKGIKINNTTKYQLTEDMLNFDNYEINKSKVLIYHTHTTESYTQTNKLKYNPSGSFRCLDLNYTVAKVGDELEKQLDSYGIKTIHDKTVHDYPAYNGSYSRSLKTIEKMKKENPDADIAIDLHRDAIQDSTYAPKVKIGDEYVSQIMFVIGSDFINKNHKNWTNNLKYALKVQQKANQMYPRII